MNASARLVRSHPDELLIGLVSVSDRASAGAYQDQGLPAAGMAGNGAGLALAGGGPADSG